MKGPDLRRSTRGSQRKCSYIPGDSTDNSSNGISKKRCDPVAPVPSTPAKRPRGRHRKTFFEKEWESEKCLETKVTVKSPVVLLKELKVVLTKSDFIFPNGKRDDDKVAVITTPAKLDSTSTESEMETCSSHYNNYLKIDPEIRKAVPDFNPVGSMKRLQRVIEMVYLDDGEDDFEVSLADLDVGNVNWSSYSDTIKREATEIAETKNPNESFKTEKEVAGVQLQDPKVVATKPAEDINCLCCNWENFSTTKIPHKHNNWLADNNTDNQALPDPYCELNTSETTLQIQSSEIESEIEVLEEKPIVDVARVTKQLIEFTSTKKKFSTCTFRPPTSHWPVCEKDRVDPIQRILPKITKRNASSILKRSRKLHTLLPSSWEVPRFCYVPFKCNSNSFVEIKPTCQFNVKIL